MQSATTELSSKLHNVYFSKEKTSEITYRFHQFLFNLENTNAHINFFLEKIKEETNDSDKNENNVYYIQKDLMEILKQIKDRNEEEQRKMFHFQKEFLNNLNATNEEIKSVETLININQYNEQDVNELINSISTIYSLIELVRGISNQINLLSLNAAIESSKTGDLGKGFSVIAKEIKYLQLDVINTLTEISIELSNIERYSIDIKEGTKKIEKKAEELKNGRIDFAENISFVKDFIKTYLEINEKNNQKLGNSQKDVDDSLKSLAEMRDSTNRLSDEIQEFDIHFSQQKKTTNKLKNVLKDLQIDLIKTAKELEHKKE